mmetsp:Transcript_29986/g.64231  ORF Transcript_29986/g.64231 Transcript_29986/m.64231 type:complete len:498 (-) Transcript_29986:249-1742(-)|eukprot:CAMPEP_0201119012 /NCGR_PEP_ID=MMETSP0850-20130426/3191_1 /ASSEMBLY_ACC=CAM_ASM_000622 /TAXON_ID=183588 /ORGANISM="Pseudo-nitzschia fraudulenta, Strain WWA7" /LENGTH=497 /DNA_ID=CAMNT_0047384551 /DNA_START=72 /DNA_END=1565 /DNA_ORIENTATION=-
MAYTSFMAATRMFWLLQFLLSTAGIFAADASIGFLPEESSITFTLNQVARFLENSDTSDSAASFMTEMNRKIEEVLQTMSGLESLTKRLSETESRINSMLDSANRRQIQILVDRLDKTLEKELRLRELEREEQEKQKNLKVSHYWALSGILSDINDGIEITTDYLDWRLDTNVIMEESEMEMKKWVLSILEDELTLYKQAIFDLAPDVDESDSDDSVVVQDKETKDCPSLINIVQKVQEALNDHAVDGIGKLDHAQGASVVHWLTSETHAPPVGPSGTLGSVWWSKFIPEDWERLLPSGWENWEINTPSYIYHSLGSSSGGIAPPEAILQKNTLPGSCWPMKGSNGQITLKFAYPVYVDSVSIDHISWNIIPQGKHDSAPKRMKVIGYPPCDEMDSNCGAAGFDVSDPIDIADIDYDVEGPSVQTFESYYTKAIASLPTPEFDANELDSGSCSMQTSCSKPPRISVAAVEVKVLENWGNEDFTCLYRLRVHGDPDEE